MLETQILKAKGISMRLFSGLGNILSNCLLGRAKVDHLASVDQHDFVELLIQSLRSLIQRDQGGTLGKVGQSAKRLDITDGRGGVETTSRVIPNP